MKISRVRHILITSIIFLIIIACLCVVHDLQMQIIKEECGEKLYRVIATENIDVGELITEENVEEIVIYDSVDVRGSIYRLMEFDNHVESFDETLRLHERNGNDDIIVESKDDLWALGKVAKEKIYKGEILLNQRLEIKSDV